MEGMKRGWRKPSYSGNNGGACVEAANADHVFVRDSKDQDGPRLAISPDTWHAFMGRIKRES
jgi:Domain of unknown function (DUF397)